MKILIIDNFDSSTYNLVDELEKRGCEVLIYRNNIDLKLFDKMLKQFKPDILVFSSGPGTPKEAGNSVSIIREYHKKIPVFGIGLGFQCIIEAFDGKVSRSAEIAHGKQSKITHDSLTIFKGMPEQFRAGRYDSLAASDVPYCFEVSSRTKKGTIMSVRHKELPIEGIQFHPESILTPLGYRIIDNIIKELAK